MDALLGLLGICGANCAEDRDDLKARAGDVVSSLSRPRSFDFVESRWLELRTNSTRVTTYKIGPTKYTLLRALRPSDPNNVRAWRGKPFWKPCCPNASGSDAFRLGREPAIFYNIHVCVSFSSAPRSLLGPVFSFPSCFLSVPSCLCR